MAKTDERLFRSIRLRNRMRGIDLASFLSECELNYAKLIRIFPSIRSNTARALTLFWPDQSKSELQMCVVEQTPHTTMLNLALLDQNAFIKTAKMQIRVYHDMKVVEVICVQSIDVRRAALQIGPMLHNSDRLQVSVLLGEWLDYCLQFGAVAPSEINVSHAERQPAGPDPGRS